MERRILLAYNSLAGKINTAKTAADKAAAAKIPGTDISVTNVQNLDTQDLESHDVVITLGGDETAARTAYKVSRMYKQPVIVFSSMGSVNVLSRATGVDKHIGEKPDEYILRLIRQIQEGSLTQKQLNTGMYKSISEPKPVLWFLATDPIIHSVLNEVEVLRESHKKLSGIPRQITAIYGGLNKAFVYPKSTVVQTQDFERSAYGAAIFKNPFHYLAYYPLTRKSESDIAVLIGPGRKDLDAKAKMQLLKDMISIYMENLFHRKPLEPHKMIQIFPLPPDENVNFRNKADTGNYVVDSGVISEPWEHFDIQPRASGYTVDIYSAR